MKTFVTCTVVLCMAFSYATCTRDHQIPGASTVSALRFIGEQIVPNRAQYNNTTLGGFSSISYRPDNNQFYIMSDDAASLNPFVRFYTATLNYNQTAFAGVNFTGVTPLKNSNGTDFATSQVDPEGLQFDAATQRIIWSSEGIRNVAANPPVLIQPFIREANLDGSYVADFTVPDLFRIQSTENGTRSNGSFEGLAMTPNHQFLFAASEEPLYEDGPRADVGVAGSPIRIIKYNRQTRQPVAQYAYRLDAVHQNTTPAGQFRLNGVVDMIALSETQLLVMERSFAVGATPDYVVKIYKVDLTNATNVAGVNALQGASFMAATKTLLLDVGTTGIQRVDNLEGMTFGPMLANGNRSLVMVSDDNFGAAQISQFLVFEVIP
ncbi:esterase-like activity of phytase family protein [Nibrella saemangeumensis]|uniref:Esterase-like activity of phytase family protein n=1 Tax=Nibrella saemangeumensis TaxID=1084526 RepID=A0ABP8MP35_9BACT